MNARIKPIILSLLAALNLAVAQDAQDNPQPASPQQNSQPARGWRRVGDQQPADAPHREDSQESSRSQDVEPPYAEPPSHLTIKAGTFVTVRINQWLSSDRNQPGDAFSATLARPIVVEGVVVAQAGQIVGGRVTEARKAGRVEGVSRLGLQLTELTLVDGQQVPIESHWINRRGPASVGRDAGAIAGTTALGSAIGAAAGWGTGAAIGAGAGAAAGVIGVLLTRGEPTVVHPESLLTFKLEDTVRVSTERAPQAFRYVEPSDYERPQYAEDRPPRPMYPPPPPPYYYYGPGYYPYYGAGFFGGPGFFFGRGFYGRGFYGGGFRRGRW